MKTAGRAEPKILNREGGFPTREKCPPELTILTVNRGRQLSGHPRPNLHRQPRKLLRPPQMTHRRIRKLVGQSRPLLVRELLTPLRLLQERPLGDVGMAAR